MSNNWSEEQKARLHDLIHCANTKPYSEIASIMNREFETTRFNRNTISGAVMRMRMPTRGHHFQTVAHERKVSENPYRVTPEKPYRGGVKMIDVGPTQCRYPHGDPAKPGFVLCGRETGGRTYCKRHEKISFVEPKKLNVSGKLLDS